MALVSNEIKQDFSISTGKERRLGKGAAIGSTKLLTFSKYDKNKAVEIPETYNYYKGKKPVPVQEWGNNEYGDCTIASQGIGAQHMERVEQRKNVIISKQSIVDTYFNMVERVYGSREDSGAFEMDALNNWRNKDYTFRDSKGNPFTIDAYTRINYADLDEVKRALLLSGSHGIKVCFALPLAWATSSLDWDIPEGQQPVGAYRPYSWGGHSMWAISHWDKNWLYLPSSWNEPMGRISWRAFAIYCDEAYSVIDSVNAWKKRVGAKAFNFKALVSDINDVSDVKIAA